MTNKSIWTIGDVLTWSAKYFGSRGIDTPRLDAEVLLAHTLRETRIYLYMNFDKPLNPAELASFRDAVRRRANREPVAYITGKKEFMGLSFSVSPAVLVPRPDTETLVAEAISRLSKKDSARIADIGTGSGAIALSLLKNIPGSTASATDISSDALAVAKKNAAELGLSERIRFGEGDLLAPLAGEKFDLIASNPPYIRSGEISSLAPEVLREPRSALDGGADGLDFYRRIISDAPPYLREGGLLAVECGAGQAGEIASLARDSGHFGEAETIRDLAGIERVVIMYGGEYE